MNAKKTILFPIEIKPRELNSKVLLALERVKKGMRCYIGSKIAMKYVLTPKLSGGIYFYKGGMATANIKKLKTIFNHFVVLDEEMGPTVHLLDKAFEMRIEKAALPYIDKMFVIGDKHLESACRVYHKDNEVIIATGWPRIDLWRPEFLNSYQQEMQSIKARFDDYILFPSNFGVTSEKMLAARIKSIEESDVDEEAKKFRRDKANYLYQSFLKHIALLEELSAKQNLTIIVRPHPSDDHAGWTEKIGKMPNVKVIYEGEISPWLYASKGLLHHGCTTSIQAGIAGIPSIVYQKPQWALGETLVFDVSEEGKTVEEILFFFNNSSHNKSAEIRAKTLEILENEIASLNNTIASTKITEILDELDTPATKYYQFNTLDKIIAEFYHWAHQAKVFLDSKILGKVVPQPNQKIPGGINASEIKETINKFATIIKMESSQIRCEQVSRDLIVIEQL